MVKRDGDQVGGERTRAIVLARIRAALGRDPRLPDIPRDYRAAGEHPPGSPELLDLLADRLTDYRASVVRTTAAAVPAAVAATLSHLLPAGGRVLAPAGLPSGWCPQASVDDGRSEPSTVDSFDAVVTGCAAACAETGTIALDAGADQGRRMITLVPDRHLCVVRADQVVQTVPELLARLDPTRPITLVAGPSATSDIELHRVEGVHGPRTLVVLLVTD
jgi:L-lactate dehydrogenase complex protein LldG